MKREKGILLNTLTLGAAALLSKSFSLFLMPLYTACLSPGEFGTADVLVSTAVLLIPVVTLGAPESVFRFVAGGEECGECVGVGLLSALLGVLLFLLFLPLLGASPLFAPHLLLFFLYVLFAAWHGFLAHLTRARGRYLLFAVQQLICALLTMLLELLFLPALELGVPGYLGAILLADAFTALGLALVLWHEGAFRPRRFRRTLLQEMWRYALPLIPTTALWWVISLSDRYLLLRFCGEESVGLYAAAGRLPALLSLTSSVFLEVWRYASLREAKGMEGGLFERIYGLFLPSVLALTGVLILGGDLAVSQLLAPSFAPAGKLVPLLALASFFSVLASFLGSVYALRMTSMHALLTALLGAGVNFALNLLLIPRFSCLGAACATLAAWVLVWSVRAADCHALLPFTQRIQKTLLAAFFSGIAVLSATANALPSASLFVLASLCVFARELREGRKLTFQAFTQLAYFVFQRGKKAKVEKKLTKF